MKNKTINNRRSRRKAKGSTYSGKKRKQYRGIFRASSPFIYSDSGTGITLAQFKSMLKAYG